MTFLSWFKCKDQGILTWSNTCAIHYTNTSKQNCLFLKQIHNKTIWWVVLERKILDHILKSPNAFKTLYTRWRRQTSIDMYYTCFQNIMLHHLNTCPMKLHTKHSLNKTKNWSTTTQMETTRKWVSVGLIHSVNEMVQ